MVRQPVIGSIVRYIVLPRLTAIEFWAETGLALSRPLIGWDVNANGNDIQLIWYAWIRHLAHDLGLGQRDNLLHEVRRGIYFFNMGVRQ
jgi:hypothetical protein